MASLFDVFGRLLLDDSQFQPDAVKAGEKAGDAVATSMGQRMSSALRKAGPRILGGALAAGAALATKGLLELDKVVGDFQADTGATADEADRAGKAINDMAGRNIQPLAEVGAALTKVHTDLGLTGDEAARTTEKFLKFGRATKQNAAAAVVAFDDILDAWGLTAEHAGAIMDKLIVSHQRYGGSIEENEAALAALAPALKGANLTIDDGIGLLNLFEASGVDSAAAVTGMTKALTKVKSPAELKRLVDDIMATEDPFLRAQKASDLFGVRAGAKLANALRPGAQALEDYTISTEDSAGATEKAADVLDSRFGARFQLLLKQAGAALIGFGSNFGPALTGLASLASLGGAVGGGKLVSGILKPLGGLGKKLALRVATALGFAFGSSVVAGAAEQGGEAVGSMTTAAIQKRLAGKAAGNALAEGLIGLETPAVAKATSHLGDFLGSKIGKAFSVAFAAVAVVELVKTYADVTDAIRQQTADLAKQTGDFTEQATLEALVNARNGVAEQLDNMGHDPIAEALGLSARAGIEATLGDLETAIAQRMTDADEAVRSGRANIADSAAGIGGSFIDVGAAVGTMAQRIQDGVAKIEGYVHGLTTTLAAEARAMISGYYDPLIAQDELLVQKDQVAAAERARNATKAGTEERHQAQLTLDTARAQLAQTRLALLESGKLSAKEQKTWLSELQKKYSTATGSAKTKLGELIAKIKELQGSQGKGITIAITGLKGGYLGGARASGGPVAAGVPYLVNENTPNSEVFVPRTAGSIMTRPQWTDRVAAMAGGGGGAEQAPGVALTLYGRPLEAQTPADVVREVRRSQRLGVAPRRKPPRWKQ